jgi:hypothetical protein
MQNLKFTIIFGLIFIASTLQIFASETRNIVLDGGVNIETEASVLVHNTLPVTARFKVSREGSNTNTKHRLLRFQLISPNGAVYSINKPIGEITETVVLNLPAAGGGNNVRSWKAEMNNIADPRYMGFGRRVRGTVEFYTTGSQTATIPAPAKFGLIQSDSATKIILMPFTGNLTIQANWDTDEISLEAYQLKFELYKGSTKLASDTGYSRDSIVFGVSDSQRMKISYRVKATDFKIPGDWKVKVYGSSKGKVKNVDLKMIISDGLYE